MDCWGEREIGPPRFQGPLLLVDYLITKKAGNFTLPQVVRTMMISKLPKGSFFFSNRGNREVFDMKMATRQKKWHQFLRQQSFILLSSSLLFSL